MPSWAIALLTVLSGPVGALINKGLAMGAASFVTWQISKGIPADTASNIAGEIVAAVSTAISYLAGTQGVKINSVNTASNGVKVVPASSPTPAVNTPLH